MLGIGINIMIGVLGLAVYIGWNTRDYIVDRTFSLKKGYTENRNRMAWVVFMIILLAVVYRIVPEAFSQMGGLEGLEVPKTVEKGTFFGLALLLSKYVKLLVRKQS